MTSVSQIDFNNQAFSKQDLLKCVTYGATVGAGTALSLGLTYEELAPVITFTGGSATTGNITLAIVKSGNAVTIRFPNVAANFTANAVSNSAIDQRIWPNTTINWIVPGEVNSVQGSVQVSLSNAGIFTITQTNGSAFSTGANGLFATAIDYTLI